MMATNGSALCLRPRPRVCRTSSGMGVCGRHCTPYTSTAPSLPPAASCELHGEKATQRTGPARPPFAATLPKPAAASADGGSRPGNPPAFSALYRQTEPSPQPTVAQPHVISARQ
jgi:hypothetical protein